MLLNESVNMKVDHKVRFQYPLVEGVNLIEEASDTVVIGAVFSITDISTFDALDHGSRRVCPSGTPSAFFNLVSSAT